MFSLITNMQFFTTIAITQLFFLAHNPITSQESRLHIHIFILSDVLVYN